MSTETTPNKIGRPLGKDFPRVLRVYEDDEGVRLAQTLAKTQGMSVSGLYRDLLRKAARRAGISDGRDLTQAAAEAREYYLTDPEVREWQDMPHDFPPYDREAAEQPAEDQKPQPGP